MERPLTPPPSLRAIRVRTRPHTRMTWDENRCGNYAPDRSTEYGAVPGRSRKETSPARGRTRSRNVRNGLTLNTNSVHQHLSFGLPPCCSPVPSRSDIASASGDDDLIFQMSPVQTKSPSLLCFEGLRETRSDADRLKESTTQTLAALWEKHKNSLSSTAPQPRTPTRHTRAYSVTQHHRGFSDTHASDFPRREKRGEHRSQKSVKAMFDLSPILHAPTEPPSPPTDEPFMYSFPTFDSSPLAKAREARASRQPTKMSVRTREEYLTDGLDSEPIGGRDRVSLGTEISTNPSKHRHGPIRARNLRIQSGESLSDDLDDTNYISHAFKSASLDPEKDADLDRDDREAFGDGYLWSQRSSSVSSSSTSDAASLSRSPSNHFSSSILASFPVRPSSRSRTHSNSSSRAKSRRVSANETSPEATATAMMNRGRTARRASNEMHQTGVEYAGGDRRGRGRTPPPGWRSAKDAFAVVSSDERTRMR